MNFQLSLQFGLSVLSVIIFFFVSSAANSAVTLYGQRQNHDEKRMIYIKKFFNASLVALLTIIIAVIWGIDFKGVVIFASSFFAVVGIGLFASWSILSNITSNAIIFFSFPYKIGDRIRVIDGDNSVEGRITDMTLFHIRIENENKDTVSYPNNLAIQRPVIQFNDQA